MSMNIKKRIIIAPATQAQPIKRPLPAPADRRTGEAGGQTGGFPVGFPHREQNAASLGNSVSQWVQFILAMGVKGFTPDNSPGVVF